MTAYEIGQKAYKDGANYNKAFMDWLSTVSKEGDAVGSHLLEMKQFNNGYNDERFKGIKL